MIFLWSCAQNFAEFKMAGNSMGKVMVSAAKNDLQPRLMVLPDLQVLFTGYPLPMMQV